MSKPAQQLARCLGFDITSSGRQYISPSACGGYRFLLARARDIPAYVESGSADLGITGRDVALEQGSANTELLAFPFGYCRLVYATPKGQLAAPKRVASAFPNLTARFLATAGIDAQIVRLDGAIEASVQAGIADAVIDLSATGKTLVANGLEEKAVIMESSAVLIGNPNALLTKKALVDTAVSLLRGDVTIFQSDLTALSPKERWRLIERNRIGGETLNIQQTVREIFANVEKNRDEALTFFSQKFDQAVLSPKQFEVRPDEIKQAYAQVSPDVIAALNQSAQNIRRFCQKELPLGFEIKMDGGLMGKRIVPLESVGIYAPGGTAAYPSSVLMGVVPAKVAGVSQIVLCTPCDSTGKCNPSVLVAADLAGATRVFKLGGAQAIAAMAIGTRTVPKVAKIVGPGNAYVAAAKLEALSRGLVSIDSPAGPSEVLVIADDSANPAYVASELIAQAEHSPDAAAVLVSMSKQLADAVKRDLQAQLLLLPRRPIAIQSLEKNGAILLANDLGQAMDFANQYAPEHLVLQIERPMGWLDKVKTAGAVFLGENTPVAAGDYGAGPNHVLPTGGYCKSYSGLSARDFTREVNYLKLEKRGLEVLAPTIVALANAEGLSAHAESVKRRFEVTRP